MKNDAVGNTAITFCIGIDKYASQSEEEQKAEIHATQLYVDTITC